MSILPVNYFTSRVSLLMSVELVWVWCLACGGWEHTLQSTQGRLALGLRKRCIPQELAFTALAPWHACPSSPWSSVEDFSQPSKGKSALYGAWNKKSEPQKQTSKRQNWSGEQAVLCQQQGPRELQSHRGRTLLSPAPSASLLCPLHGARDQSCDFLDPVWTMWTMLFWGEETAPPRAWILHVCARCLCKYTQTFLQDLLWPHHEQPGDLVLLTPEFTSAERPAQTWPTPVSGAGQQVPHLEYSYSSHVREAAAWVSLSSASPGSDSLAANVNKRPNTKIRQICLIFFKITDDKIKYLHHIILCKHVRSLYKEIYMQNNAKKFNWNNKRNNTEIKVMRLRIHIQFWIQFLLKVSVQFYKRKQTKKPNKRINKIHWKLWSLMRPVYGSSPKGLAGFGEQAGLVLV